MNINRLKNISKFSQYYYNGIDVGPIANAFLRLKGPTWLLLILALKRRCGTLFWADYPLLTQGKRTVEGLILFYP